MKPSTFDSFYQKAMYIARKSTMRQKHGCVIVYNNKEIIAEGYNHVRNNNMEKLKSIHAEMEAIKKLRQIMRTKDKNFVNKCKLYVVRIGESSVKQSAPCCHCSKAIISIGIQKVCYSVDKDLFEEEFISNVLKNISINTTAVASPPKHSCRTSPCK